MSRTARAWAPALAVALFLTLALTLAFSLAGPLFGSAAKPGTALLPEVRADEQRVFLSASQAARAAGSGFLPAGTRSILKISKRMKYGDFIWDDEGVPDGPISIRIDVRLQLLSVFRAGHEIGSAVILYGADGYETPLGSYPILARLRDHVSSTYDAAMPFTLRLTHDGVAVHASEVRRGRATHGCIGIPPRFAERLFDAARVGDTVHIVRSGSTTT